MTRSGFLTNGAAARTAGGASSVKTPAGPRWLPGRPTARSASPRARWRGAGRRGVPRQKAAWPVRARRRRSDRTDQPWSTLEWSGSRSWLLLLAVIHCRRCQRFWPSSPRVYPLCRLSRPSVWRRGQDGGMSRRPAVLLHLVSSHAWSSAKTEGVLRPESLRRAGFVHLSTPEQVHLPANRLYPGRDDLVLLHIDPALLESPVRWEPGVETDPESMLFPHLYGRLPVRAVINVTAYPPGPDGTFPPVPEPQDPVGDST